jgi:ABC-type antimicrobial peptide transport system permease subunit
MRRCSRAWSKAKFTNLIALEDAEFTRSYSQFKILKATAWAVGGCGLLLGGFGVANTMIMSVFTRIREIAILRVCGFSHLQIAAMIFGESAVVSFAGAVLGLLTGSCLLYALKLVPALHGYVDVTLQPCRDADRNSAGFDHWNRRRALPGSLCHAYPSGGGAALRMNHSIEQAAQS